MPRLLATAVSALATARTWVAPPSVPSTAGERTVCTLSRTSSEGLTCLDVGQHGRQLGLGGQVEPLVQGADPLGPQPHLGGGLLAGDDQRGPVGRGDPVGDLEQQRGLADARARRRPAAPRRAPARRRAPGRTRSMPVGTARAPASSTSAIGRAGAVTGPADDRPQRRRRRPPTSAERAPGLALGAAADPLGGGDSRTRCSGGRGGRTSRQRAARGDANPGCDSPGGTTEQAVGARRPRSAPRALLVVEVEALAARAGPRRGCRR